MASFRNLLFAVIAVAAFAGFMLGGPSFQPTQTTATTSSDESSIANDAANAERTNSADEKAVHWSHGQDGANANAGEHWRKHGAQFSEDHNAQEYEDEASNFLHHPPPGAEIKHRADGDTLIYDRGSNTFAVENSQGEPRTMFKPDRGQSYWDRQH
jgi:pyocin large subunit-like protein